MHKWRSLFVAGVVLSVLVLFGTTTASAQIDSVMVTVNVVPAGHGSLQVTWSPDGDNIGNITGYELRYQKSSPMQALDEEWDPAESGILVDVEKTQIHTLRDLAHGTFYVVEVRAYERDVTGKDDAASSWTDPTSNPSTKTLEITKPGKVSGLKLTPGDGYIMAMWNEPDDNGVDIIMYTVETSSAMATITLEVTDTEAMISGLTNGTEYEVMVRAHNAETDDGAGVWSDVAKETPVAAPEPLAAPMPTVGTPTHDSVMVSWGAVEGARGYSLNWRMDGSGVGLNAWVGMETEYTITDLAPEMMYSVNVCAAPEAEGMDDACSADMSFTTAMAPTETPALPLFGAVALGAGLLAAGRRRMRRRAQLRGRELRQMITR